MRCTMRAEQYFIKIVIGWISGWRKNRNLDKHQCKSYRMQPVTLGYQVMMLCWLYLHLALNLEFFKAKQHMQQNSSQRTIWKTLQEGKPMKITESLGAEKKNKKNKLGQQPQLYKFPCVCHWNKNNQTETKSGKRPRVETNLPRVNFYWVNQSVSLKIWNKLWLKPPIWTEKKHLTKKTAAAPHTFQLPRQALKIGWVDKKVSEPKITKCRLARDLAADGSVPCSWL